MPTPKPISVQFATSSCDFPHLPVCDQRLPFVLLLFLFGCRDLVCFSPPIQPQPFPLPVIFFSSCFFLCMRACSSSQFTPPSHLTRTRLLLLFLSYLSFSLSLSPFPSLSLSLSVQLATTAAATDVLFCAAPWPCRSQKLSRFSALRNHTSSAETRLVGSSSEVAVFALPATCRLPQPTISRDSPLLHARLIHVHVCTASSLTLFLFLCLSFVHLFGVQLCLVCLCLCVIPSPFFFFSSPSSHTHTHTLTLPVCLDACGLSCS